MTSFSVNTNVASLDALQNLNATGRDLDQVRLRINSGLRVNGAKDDSAAFAIAQNLRADVSSLSAVQQSLDRTKSVLDITISAAENVQNLLIQIREKVVAASDGGLDANSRTALKTDYERLRDQLVTQVKSATFNGVNLIDGPASPPAKPTKLSAIISPDGKETIDIPRIDFQLFDVPPTTTGGIVQATGATVSNTGGVTTVQGIAATGISTNGTVNTATTGSTTVYTTSGSGSIILQGTQVVIAGGLTTTPGGVTNYGGNQYTLAPTETSTTLGGTTTVVPAGAVPPQIRITNGSVSIINGVATVTSGQVDVIAGSASTADGTPTVPSTVVPVPSPQDPIPASNVVQLRATDTFTDAPSALTLLSKIDLSIQLTGQGLTTLGSASRTIDQQNTFSTKLSDTLQTGVGNLVDADLARESARLQALNVKQQLGTQALSLANNAPQNILQLFK